jgi:signal transduction histidine kinase
MTRAPATKDSLDWLANGGEMGQRIRAFDWASTPIGPIESWSPALRMMVGFLLTNPHPILLWWGPRYISIYNDTYAPILGTKHPGALGQPCSECWTEIWHILKPLIDTPFHGGPATWIEDFVLELHRHAFLDEGHFTVSYSAVPDETAPGGTGGVCAIVHEITDKVVGERRVVALRDVGACAGEGKTAEEACAAAARTLAPHDKDLPFVLLYLIDADGKVARLAGAAGVVEGGAASPQLVDLDGPDPPWPLSEAIRSEAMVVVDDLVQRFGDAVPQGPWSDLPRQAVVVPIRSNIAHELAGLLVAGVSPRLRLDGLYRSFYELLATQLATAIANARAYEVERKRAEELAELDRAKTAFFSNVSHEFRTPLTLLLGPVEELLARDPVESIHDQLEVVHRNGLRLLKLVNSLLDFSRIEAGRIQAAYEPLDLAALTPELAGMFRAGIERAGLRFLVDCRPLDPTQQVYVDRDMWEKIVLNLLSNAFKFTLEGEIEVRQEALDRELSLTVRDTGLGIPADELSRVFERFHRVKSARGRTHEGTGIGLSLVQELVKLHGGTVHVESVLGRGSSFTVRIPFGTAHLDPRSVRAPSEHPGADAGAVAFLEEALRWLPASEQEIAAAPTEPKSGRILWADDNADMRAYVARLLGERFEVEAVGDGEAALASARANPPDLVLTDVMMPRLDGFGLLRELRNDPALAEVPIILISARAGEESRVEGVAAGADDYLVKPFGARELMARVETHVKMSRLRRDAKAQREQLLQSERAARSDAEQANRLKDEFLATLSHELRSPLNAILGWTYLMEREPENAAIVRQGVEVVARSARLQAALISDLLDMSRIAAGKIRLEIEDVSLPPLVTGSVDAIRHVALAKGVRVESTIEPIDDPVRADSTRIEQIVSNLLSNAVKFTPQGGLVRVDLARQGAVAQIVVHDTGVGIRREFLPYVFERFRQADAPTTRHTGGLGLGMAIVKQLCELHGGTVGVESGGEGQGATFTVRLPLARREGAQPPRPTAAEDRALDGVRVLAIDDQAEVRELLKRVLEERNAEVITAASVEEGVRVFEEHKPHVVLCDIGMPGQNGYDFIRQVRETGSGTPALAVTAFAGSEDSLRSLRAGYQAHISKPVDFAELVSAVAALAKNAPVLAGSGLESLPSPASRQRFET